MDFSHFLTSIRGGLQGLFHPGSILDLILKFFVAIDPIVVVPIFISITAYDSPQKKRSAANRAVIATWVTLAFFAVAGGFLFSVFGISIGTFRMAGGLILLLTALDMMRAQPSSTRSTKEEQQESVYKDDVALVPLAIPMLAGPGAITMVMSSMPASKWEWKSMIMVFVAITVNCLITWCMLRYAAKAEHFLTKTKIRVFERLMGLFLCAVAMSFILKGLHEVIGKEWVDIISKMVVTK